MKLTDYIPSEDASAERWAQNNAVEEARQLRAKVLVLESLCGEMIATLRVNLLRQTLTTQDDAEFERMLDAWSEQLRRQKDYDYPTKQR